MKKALLMAMAVSSTGLFGMYGAGGFWNTGSDSWSNPSDSHCPDESHCISSQPLESAREYVDRATDMSHMNSITCATDYNNPNYDSSNADTTTTTTGSSTETSNQDEN